MSRNLLGLGEVLALVGVHEFPLDVGVELLVHGFHLGPQVLNVLLERVRLVPRPPVGALVAETWGGEHEFCLNLLEYIY